MSAATSSGLPPLTDLHQIFNPSIAPPLAMNNSVATATAKDQRDTENGVSTGVLSKLKLVLGGSGNGGGKGPSISSPTGFKHVVHVSGTTIEMYGEHGSGSPVPSSSGQNGGAKREGDLEMVTMSRIDGSFGMNLKTLDNGKTLISKINERGAAELTGQLIVNDEIVMIDGEKIRGWKHNDVINLLKDKTTVQLHIEKMREATSSTELVSNSCRICGNPANFNCSACGVDVMYCSSPCQKQDWPKHKLECLVMKKNDPTTPTSPVAKTSPTTPAVPLTGACRVCRDKNARYRCNCAGVMYCSSNCQSTDWPSHKFHCSWAGNNIPKPVPATTSPPVGRTGPSTGILSPRPVSSSVPAGPPDFSFYLALDRHVFKMAFTNGVFEYLWTTELSKVQLSQMSSFPTLIVRNKSVFVSTMSLIYCLEAETGKLVWSSNLGYPFSGDPFVLDIVDDSILVAAGAGQIVAVNQTDGSEISRKLLSRSFEPVTLLRTHKYILAVAGNDAFGIQISPSSKDPFHLLWRSALDIRPTNGATLCSALALIPPLLEDDSSDGRLAVFTDRLHVFKLTDGALLSTSTKLIPDPAREVYNLHYMNILAAGRGLLCWRVSTGSLVYVDTATWKEMWTTDIDECKGREATLLKNSIVFEGSEGLHNVVYVGVNNAIVSVDLTTGEAIWLAKFASAKEADPNLPGIVSIMRIQDTLIAASSGRVYALNATNGNPLRRAQLPQNSNAQRFISACTSFEPNVNSSVLPSQIVLYRRE